MTDSHHKLCVATIFSAFGSPVETRIEKFIGLLIVIEGFGEGNGRGLDHCVGDVLCLRDDSTEADSREHVPARQNVRMYTAEENEV